MSLLEFQNKKKVSNSYRLTLVYILGSSSMGVLISHSNYLWRTNKFTLKAGIHYEISAGRKLIQNDLGFDGYYDRIKDLEKWGGGILPSVTLILDLYR